MLRSCRPPPYAERCMQAHQPLYTFFFIKTSALMACKSDFHSLIRTESAFWCSWPVGSIGSTRNVLKPTSKAELLTRPRISVFRLTRPLAADSLPDSLAHFLSYAETLSLYPRVESCCTRHRVIHSLPLPKQSVRSGRPLSHQLD